MPDNLTAALDEIREHLAHRDALMEQAMTARRVPQTAISENRDRLVADVPRLLAALDAVLARHVPKTVTVTRLLRQAPASHAQPHLPGLHHHRARRVRRMQPGLPG
jgi:hypothetical protein